MNYKTSHILFKFPVRERKDKMLATLHEYYKLMVDRKNFTFLVSIDEDDEILNTKEVVWELMRFPHLQIEVGESNGKIHACNRDIESAVIKDWDILVLVSDDMVPIQKGYDMIIRKEFEKHFPDFDGVLHFNDGYQGEKLNTLCILGRKYYDRFGYIYHPSYKSLYCDNEFTDVSRMLGKVQYFSNTIIQHQHWVWGFGEMDSLYRHNEKFIQKDMDNYNKRKKMNFEIEKAKETQELT